MKVADGSFAQAYNVHVVVDSAHQITVATEVTVGAPDAPHLPSMVDATQANAGTPVLLTADAGYHSEANCRLLQAAGIDAVIPPYKVKHTDRIPPSLRGRIPGYLSPQDRMRRKLQTKAGRAIYRLHKAIAEPFIEQIKADRGFQRFLLRGLRQVRAE